MIFTVAFLLSGIHSPIAYAKPSYSFGNEPRVCQKNEDCAILIVSCHKCDWADSVNKAKLQESEKIVKDYCEKWKKQPNREPDCKNVPKVKSREALCINNQCEARTFIDFSKPKKK